MTDKLTNLAESFVYLQYDGEWYSERQMEMENISRAQQWEMFLNRILRKTEDIICFKTSLTGKTPSKQSNDLMEFYRLYFQGFPSPPPGNVFSGVLQSAFSAGKITGIFLANLAGNPCALISRTTILEGELIQSFLDTFKEINASRASKEKYHKTQRKISSITSAYIKSLSRFFQSPRRTFVGRVDFYCHEINVSEKTITQWWRLLLDQLSTSQSSYFGPVCWNIIFSPTKGLRIRGYFSFKTSGESSDLNRHLNEIDAIWRAVSMGQGYSSATVPYFQEKGRSQNFLIAEDLLPGSDFRCAISSLNEVNHYFHPEHFYAPTEGYQGYGKRESLNLLTLFS